MGARVARMFRNFNLENRVFRELSKDKPQVAPRHADKSSPPAGSLSAETGNHKDDSLLLRLRSVYVDSTEPAEPETSKEVAVGKGAECRPLMFSFPGNMHGMEDLTEVPKGKLTITEALKAMSSHQRQPQIFTPEKIAQDYSLDLRDTKALLEFFIPFEVQIIPSKTPSAKQLKSS